MIDEDLRTFLETLLPAGPTDVGGVDLSKTPIEKGKASSTQSPPFVQYQRSQAAQDVATDGTPLFRTTLFDVECYALDEATTQAIAEAFKTGPRDGTPGLNGYRGAMGATFVHGSFAEDHSDDYEPKLLDADEGYAVASLQVQLIHETA